MKTFNIFKIAPALCVGIVFFLCSAHGENPQEKPNMDCMKWVGKCLMDFKSIKPGMTRGEIQKKFPIDGGLQGASQMRFIHPECGYFKIDVDFNFKRDEKDQNRAIISPDDKAIKVSTPYIEWLSVD